MAQRFLAASFLQNVNAGRQQEARVGPAAPHLQLAEQMSVICFVAMTSLTNPSSAWS
jgi:hypothetical protein